MVYVDVYTYITKPNMRTHSFFFYPPPLKSSSDPEGIAPAHYHHQGPILHTYARTGSLNIPAADHEELARYKGPPI